MNSYSGSCLCETVKFGIEADFERFYLCHCSYCRKDTGSAHAANLFARGAVLKWHSGEDKVTQYDLPSTRHGKAFCSVCGSALPRLVANGALLIVPAGSLNDDVPMQPIAHIFTASRANWDHELERIPSVERLP